MGTDSRSRSDRNICKSGSRRIPELDKMLAEALASTSKEEQKEKYKEIYKLINEDLPTYPIYERCDLICYNTRVQNIEQSSYVKWYQQDKIVNIEVE